MQVISTFWFLNDLFPILLFSINHHILFYINFQKIGGTNMSQNSQHSISQKFYKQNESLRMKREASSTANGLSQSSNPAQEEAKKSIKSIRSSLRRSSRKISLNGSSILQNLKFHRKASIQTQNNNKPSIQTKPPSEVRNSKFKIRLSGDSSKHLPQHKQNWPIEITPQHITQLKGPNEQQKFISEGCKQKSNSTQKSSENAVDEAEEGIAEDCQYPGPVGEELEKQFDEQSQILELNSEDEEKKSQDLYVEQEVVYLIRIHLAPIVGPSLQMPARMESFQVNIQYECTGIEKFLISTLLEISEIGDEIIEEGNEQIQKKQEIKIVAKQEPSVQNENDKINEGSVNNEDHKVDESKDKLNRSRSLSISRPDNIDSKQKVSVESQDTASKGKMFKRPNLQQIANIYNHKICPSQFTQKVEKPRLQSESLQSSHTSHRIFRSHPFLDKALKNRNKILPKNMSNEKENELSIPQNRSGQKTKQMQSDQLKAKKIIKKRNINELKLKQIIQQAKNQVMVGCREVQM